MSIELHLIQNVIMRSFQNPRRSMVMNHNNIFGSILSFSREKLQQTQLWRVHTGSNLHDRYRSNRGFVVKAEDGGYHVSDESSRRDGEKNMMKSSINSSDAGKNLKQFKFRFTGEPGTEDGNGHGHGHGGGGSGDDTNNSGGGHRGSDDGCLIDMVWWWWWQWQRVLRICRGCGGGYSRGLLWLPGFDMIVSTEIANGAAAAELVLNLRVTMLDQVIPLIFILPLLPFYLLFSAYVRCWVCGRRHHNCRLLHTCCSGFCGSHNLVFALPGQLM